MERIKIPTVKIYKLGLHNLFIKTVAKAMNVTTKDAEKIFDIKQ